MFLQKSKKDWLCQMLVTHYSRDVIFPDRISYLGVFCKKGVLRNFTKFTGKHLRQSLFFNNVAGLRPATLLKKRLWHRCFPVNFAKFLRALFLQNTSGGCFSYDHQCAGNNIQAC